MKSAAILALVLGLPASAAQAATMVSFTGNANGALASGSASISLDAGNNSITGTLTNTSPDDARITGFGFNIGPGNLNGFTGTPNPITTPSGVNFGFHDDDLGNVPQFNGIGLDFGYATGPSFAGGSPNDGLDNFQTLGFVVAGSFAGLTEEQIASGLFVRFQRVGPNGEGSDVAVASIVGTPTPFSTAPEPASLLLLGTGLIYLAHRRVKSAKR
jgi:hypothetical protein